MDEAGSFFAGMLLMFMIVLVGICQCDTMSLRTSTIKLQKQECQEITGFNGKKFVLCPGECEKSGKFELCYKTVAEKE